jgi:MFS family permease
MSSIASYTYGPLLIQDTYGEDEQSQADDAISLIIMLSNILIIPLALGFGWLLDRTHRWKILAFNTLLVVACLILMIISSRYKEQEGHAALLVGVCGFMTFNIVNFLVVSLSRLLISLQIITMVGTVAKKHNTSGGIIFGAFSLFGSLGTMLISKLGGYLYTKVWHCWPFVMTLVVTAVLLLITLILGLLKKIQ